MLWKNMQTWVLEVFTVEDRVQCGGSKEEERKGNGGNKGKEEQKEEQDRSRRLSENTT